MKIPYFKAKTIDEHEVEGFYFEYPETTYCFTEDYERSPVKLKYAIVTYQMLDWGLANKPIMYDIDINTLEQIGFVDTETNTYIPNNWVKREE